MKRTLIIALALGTAMCTRAQEQPELTLGADFVSQYVWRGMELGQTSVQPTLGIGWKGLSLSAWGSMSTVSTSETKEIDLTLSYSIGGLSFGITDYWCDDPDTRYFYYNAHGTSHVFEGFVGYDFGCLRASWQTIFAGNDGLNDKCKRAYSSYAELTAPFKLASCQWEATVGAVPYATSYYDTTGFAVTNVSLKATKDIVITDSFHLPVFAQLVGNPRSQNAFFVFGFTLQPF